MQGLGPEGARMWRLAGAYSALGMEIALAVGIGTVVGHFVDNAMDWSPYGVLVGFVIGLGAAVLGIMRAMAMARATFGTQDEQRLTPPQDPTKPSAP